MTPPTLARLASIAAACGVSGLAFAAGQPSFRSSTVAVRVDVMVTDGRQPVSGLQLDDFELRDNGVLQPIGLIESTQVPLNAVLALDTSASTAGDRRADLVTAGLAFIDGLRGDDRVALATFSHAVVPRSRLTSDFSSVRSALAGLPAAGRTAVMDGIYVALANTLDQAGSSLVVAFTDGSDVSSWLMADEVVAAAQRSSAVIYVVTSPNVHQRSALERLTGATGGDIIEIGSSADTRATFLRILEQFRSRYVLAYTPTGVPPGGFHRLDVRVKRRGLSVKVRSGYIGKSPEP